MRAPGATTVLLAAATTVLPLACALARAGGLDSAVRHYAKGEYAEAIREADMALTAGTPTPSDRARATLIKAQSLEQMGDVAGATGLYRFLVEQFPDTPEAYQAREQLARLERRRQGPDGAASAGGPAR